MVQALPTGRASGHNLGGRSCDRSSRCDDVAPVLWSDRDAGAVAPLSCLGIDTGTLAGAAI